MSTFGAAIASAGGAGSSIGNLSSSSSSPSSNGIGIGINMNGVGGGGVSLGGSIGGSAALLAAAAVAGSSSSSGGGGGGGSGAVGPSPAALQLEAPEGNWLIASSLGPPQPLPLSNNISINAAAPLAHNIVPRISSSNPSAVDLLLYDHGFGEGESGTGASQTQERVKKLPRPRQNVRSTSSTFINRVQGHPELTKILAARTESDYFTFINTGRTFVWLADSMGKVKEPLMRITFTAAPTCHDVNTFTRSNDRLDVIIGFASTGDLLWLDPLSSKYTRINKGGAVSSSGVTQVRWLPPATGSDLMFMASHADGTVIVYDATRDDPQSGQFVPAVWTPQGSVIPGQNPTAQPGPKGAKPAKERKFSRKKDKDKDKDKSRPSTASSVLSFSSNAMLPQLSTTSNAMSSSDPQTSHDTDDDAQEVLDSSSVSTGDERLMGAHRRANNVSTASTATTVTIQGTPSANGSPYIPDSANNGSASSLGSGGGGGGGGGGSGKAEASEPERRRRLSASSFLDNPLAALTGYGSASRARADTSASAISNTTSSQTGGGGRGGTASSAGGGETQPPTESQQQQLWDPMSCIIVTRPGLGTFCSPRGSDSVGFPSLLPALYGTLGDSSRHAFAEEESSGWASLAVPGKNKETAWSKCNPVSHWRISQKRITDFAISPDLIHAAFTCEDGNLRLIDMVTERLLDTFQGYFGGLTCVCWSPDGRFLLTGGQDDLVTVWAPREGRIIARCQGHSSFVTGVSFDPWRWRPEERSYRFASVGEDCKLIFWDFSSAALKRPKGHSNTGSHHAGGTANNAASFRRSVVGSTFSLLDRHAHVAGAYGHRTSLAGPAGTGPRASINTDRHFSGHSVPGDHTPVLHDAPARAEVAMLQPVVVQQIGGAAITAAAAAAALSASVNGLTPAGTSGGIPASYASTSSSSGGMQSAAAAGLATGATQDILVAVEFGPTDVIVVRKSGQIDSYARPGPSSARNH